MSNPQTATSALPAPAAPAGDAPSRRRWQRVPRKVYLARTPVDRVIALCGDLAGLSRLIGYEPATIRNWRSRQNGYLTDAQREHVEAALTAQGWVLPDGFLTETGVFETPERSRPPATIFGNPAASGTGQGDR